MQKIVAIIRHPLKTAHYGEHVAAGTYALGEVLKLENLVWWVAVATILVSFGGFLYDKFNG